LTEWSSHYLDYKGLKKFISKLLNMSSDELAKAGLLTGAAPEEDRAKLLQSQKAAFFFKLERELEKVRSIGEALDVIMHTLSR
jgi:CDK inhibitor PHO81